MTACVPMKDLKATAAFAEKVEMAKEPVVVTKHGREAFASMSVEVYDGLRRQASQAALYRSVDRDMADITAGRVRDAREATNELRERMAFSVEIADEAYIGLSEAVRYIADILGEPSTAGNLLDSFDQFSDAVSELPDLYPLCRGRALSYQRSRKALVEDYIALYMVGSGKVSVIGFFHQTQDYAKLV